MGGATDILSYNLLKYMEELRRTLKKLSWIIGFWDYHTEQQTV